MRAAVLKNHEVREKAARYIFHVYRAIFPYAKN